MPAVPPLIVILNAGSGRGDAAALQRDIESIAGAAGRQVQIEAVADGSKLCDVADAAVRRARDSGAVVVAAGGDGTINAVAQAVLGSGCAFGVLPQGTFNYFSRTHGIPADTAGAMQVLLNETPQPVQAGLVNDRIFLVNASLGLYPKLLQDREAWKQTLGRSRLVSAGSAIATALRGHRNLHVQIEVGGGRRHDVVTPSLFVANNALQLEQVGLPRARAIDAGSLVAVALKPLSRLAIFGVMLQAGRGRLDDAEPVLDFAFERLAVRGPRRLQVARDGEICTMQLPLRFSVAPDALMLVRPAAPAPERQRLAA